MDCTDKAAMPGLVSSRTRSGEEQIAKWREEAGKIAEELNEFVNRASSCIGG